MSVPARRVTAVAVTVLTASVVTACRPGEPAAPSAAPSTSTTAPSTTPPSATASSASASGTAPTAGTAAGIPVPLTDAELAWLASFSKLNKTINNEFAKDPQNQVMTRLNTLAMAATLRVCSRGLTRLGPPSRRLQPVYQTARQACGQLDKAARRAEAAAAAVGAPAAPGSPATPAHPGPGLRVCRHGGRHECHGRRPNQEHRHQSRIR